MACGSALAMDPWLNEPISQRAAAKQLRQRPSPVFGLEPGQHSPNPSPEPMFSRQRRRKCRLSGVTSYTPAATVTVPAARVPCGRYSAYTATPASAQTARYDPANAGTARARRLPERA